jgi:energy-coupling factor transporter ATP-binding protein EcfA2
VLDEPTTALVKRELNILFSVLRRLRDEGIAVIFICHCTQEIEELCDEVTVMRNGTDVGVVDPRRTSRSSCPSNHASRGPRSPRCGAVRRRAPAFFARDLATLEEPPECADGDGDAARPQLLSQFPKA